MGRTSSVVERLLALLEPYLEERQEAWEKQGGPAEQRMPTLPYTNDMKVNVRQVAKQVSNNVHDAQHFHSKVELSGPLDVVAKVQGLAPVGARSRPREDDDVLDKRIARLGKELKNQSEGHAQAHVRVAHLERKLASAKAKVKVLEERLGYLQKTGILVRTPSPAE